MKKLIPLLLVAAALVCGAAFADDPTVHSHVTGGTAPGIAQTDGIYLIDGLYDFALANSASGDWTQTRRAERSDGTSSQISAFMTPSSRIIRVRARVSTPQMPGTPFSFRKRSSGYSLRKFDGPLQISRTT